MFKLKADDKATSNSPVEIQAPELLSRNTEERMFVVDSGASMHMLSKKDLSSDELDTLQRSKKPATCSSRCNYSMKRQQFHRLVSFAQNTDIHTSGITAKTHDKTKVDDNYLYNGQLRTSRRTRIDIIFQQQFGFYIENQGSVKFIPVNRINHQTQ